MTGTGKIGIIAGDGALPAQLLRACRGEGRDVFAIALDGITVPETVADCPHAWVNIAKVGRIIDLLRQNQCGEVCLAGGVGRPDLASLKPDLKGVSLIAKLTKAARRGAPRPSKKSVRPTVPIANRPWPGPRRFRKLSARHRPP